MKKFDAETRQVNAFLRNGHPWFAFGVVLLGPVRALFGAILFLGLMYAHPEAEKAIASQLIRWVGG